MRLNSEFLGACFVYVKGNRILYNSYSLRIILEITQFGIKYWKPVFYKKFRY